MSSLDDFRTRVIGLVKDDSGKLDDPRGVGAIKAIAASPTAGGTGYSVNNVLTITGGATAATAKVISVAAGVVSVVELVTRGTGYTPGSGKATTVAPPGGTGCTLEILSVMSLESYDRHIAAALSRYSKHRPGSDVADITGDGTHDYDLPDAWVDEFSSIVSIEYPIGEVPESLMDEDDYKIYRTADAKQIRLLSDAPAVTESFRVTFTVPRGATTVPDGDVDALSMLAASFCLEELANAFAQTGDSTINADVVNYRSKSSEFSSRAKRLLQLYKEHMGLKDNDTVPAAAVIRDVDQKYPGGLDRLTHPRRARERR